MGKKRHGERCWRSRDTLAPLNLFMPVPLRSQASPGDGELWHGTWEGEESDRRIDPKNGKALERLDMPAGIGVSGLESDGADLFYCGGGPSGKVRAVRRPKAS